MNRPFFVCGVGAAICLLLSCSAWAAWSGFTSMGTTTALGDPSCAQLSAGDVVCAGDQRHEFAHGNRFQRDDMEYTGLGRRPASVGTQLRILQRREGLVRSAQPHRRAHLEQVHRYGLERICQHCCHDDIGSWLRGRRRWWCDLRREYPESYEQNATCIGQPLQWHLLAGLSQHRGVADHRAHLYCYRHKRPSGLLRARNRIGALAQRVQRG